MDCLHPSDPECPDCHTKDGTLCCGPLCFCRCHRLRQPEITEEESEVLELERLFRL